MYLKLILFAVQIKKAGHNHAEHDCCAPLYRKFLQWLSFYDFAKQAITSERIYVHQVRRNDKKNRYHHFLKR